MEHIRYMTESVCWMCKLLFSNTGVYHTSINLHRVCQAHSILMSIYVTTRNLSEASIRE
jgi:hypothetical protein